MITPLPALDRTSPTFKADTDAFFGSQIPAFVTEANALQVDVNAKQVTASEAAATATAKAEATALDAIATAADLVKTGQDRAATTADLAQTQLDRAATIQNAQATAADRIQTEQDRQAVADGLASIADGPVFRVGGQTGDVPLKTLNGAPLTGEGDIVIDPSIYRVARTGNTQLVAADKGRLIDITSGTFTQTFAAAATLGDGWFCYLQNSGSGDATIPASDGRTNWVMYPGEVRLFQCDGVALRSIVLNSFYKVFAVSGTFIKPPGYATFAGLLWGGGGGGSGGLVYGWGGGGGAASPFEFIARDVPASSTFIIGAGGAPGANGGDSSFNGYSAGGGKGGTTSAGGAGGISFYSWAGNPYVGGVGVGGQGVWGAGGGGQPNGSGGGSLYGGAGGNGGTSTALGGSPGHAPGGGGGGWNSQGSPLAPGARGELRIWGVI